MRKMIHRKLDEIEQAHGHKKKFKVGKKVLIALFILFRYSMKVLSFLFSFFVMNSDARPTSNTKNIAHDENRTADDIWKLTSGNDYYDKKPPDTFS